MRKRAGSFSRFTLLKMWLQRFGLFLLAGVAVGFLIVSKLQSPVAERIRAGATDAVSPILEAIVRPVDGISDWFGAFAGREELLKDNAGLRSEIDRLKLALAAARQLEDENKSLRFLLNAGRRLRGRHIATRVIGDPGGVFVRSLIVNSGKRDGVRKGRAVVNGLGLIGRITGVGERSARVLLITDLNSRIPVRIAGTRNRAILAGRNSNELKLQYLPRNAKIKVGAKVVTSGHGGVLPPGLPIGTVSKSDGQRVFVRANVDWNRLEFVQIVDYEAPGVVLPNRIDGVAAPRYPRKKKDRGETASR